MRAGIKSQQQPEGIAKTEMLCVGHAVLSIGDLGLCEDGREHG
jgi:hypothetical protein